VIHLQFVAQPAEEVLELVWRCRELGDGTLAGVLARSREGDSPRILDELRDAGLVAIDGGAVRLTPEGEARARTLVRRNRLAERLLHDVFEQSLPEAEDQACLMEHVLSASVTDAVCAFLGHPPTCPHGLPIPPDDCCRKRRARTVEPVVVPLTELPPGQHGRVVLIAPSVPRRIDKLATFGLVPGTVLRLRQKRPSCVVEIDGTTLALEREVAAEIYVRREGP
jgi:DtxR family Mn-dependent transcriptional regulator